MRIQFGDPTAENMRCHPEPPDSGELRRRATLKTFVFQNYIAGTYKFINEQRTVGSYARQLLGLVPARFIGRMKRQKKGLAAQTVPYDSYFEVIGAKQEFRSVTLPGWTPDVDFAESTNRALHWL